MAYINQQIENQKIFFPGIYWRGSPGKIYLTFDDGPTAACTPRLLDLLKAQSVPATFFVLGERAAENPDWVHRIAADGHRVANHGYWHRPHWFCSQEFVRESICRTNQLLEKITGVRPCCFRPPFGRFGFRAWQVCREFDLKIILWNLMPHDYRPEVNAEMLVHQVSSRLNPGKIIVLHDNLPTPDKLLSALPPIIEFVRRTGFEFDRLD